MGKKYAWLKARLAQSQKVRYTSGVAKLVEKYNGNDAPLLRLNANENHFISCNFSLVYKSSVTKIVFSKILDVVHYLGSR